MGNITINDLPEAAHLKNEFMFIVQGNVQGNDISQKVSLKQIAKFMQDELNIQFTCKGCGVVLRDIEKGCDHCGR